jgi:hypothetical protein
MAKQDSELLDQLQVILEQNGDIPSRDRRGTRELQDKSSKLK